MVKDRLLEGLFGRQVARVLAVLLTRPEEWLYQRQIADLAELRVVQAQRALDKLVALGVAQSRRDGNRVNYRANRDAPILEELCALVAKTAGVAGIVAEAIAGVSGVEEAFVFGSVAKGTADARSDVDLFVVGEASFGELTAALARARARLGREVTPIVYTAEELAAQVEARNPFILRVLSEPRLMVKGTERAAA